MSAARSWPERFVVLIRTRAGGVVRYRVVTWLGSEKAVAMAASAHESRRGDGDTAALFDVEVVEEGPANRSSDGTAQVERGDLVDRSEW